MLRISSWIIRPKKIDSDSQWPRIHYFRVVNSMLISRKCSVRTGCKMNKKTNKLTKLKEQIEK